MIKSNLKLAFAKFCLAFTLIAIGRDIWPWGGFLENSTSSDSSHEKYTLSALLAVVFFISDKIRDYDNRLSSSESQPE